MPSLYPHTPQIVFFHPSFSSASDRHPLFSLPVPLAFQADLSHCSPFFPTVFYCNLLQYIHTNTDPSVVFPRLSLSAGALFPVPADPPQISLHFQYLLLQYLSSHSLWYFFGYPATVLLIRVFVLDCPAEKLFVTTVPEYTHLPQMQALRFRSAFRLPFRKILSSFVFPAAQSALPEVP